MMTEMMGSAAQCAPHGWLMIAGGLVVTGVLGLAGAALIKYLFFTDRPRAAA